MLTNQLSEKKAYHERLQNEAISLRHDLEKSNKEFFHYQKLEGSKKILDEILCKKISPLNNTSLGKEKLSSNKAKAEGSTSHVKGVQDSNKNKETNIVGQQHQQHRKQKK